MLVKEWELSNYKKSLNDFNAILIYGTDRGKVSAIAQSLVTFSKSVYKDQLEIIKPSPDKFNNNDTSFLELMNQKSIFYNKTIFLLDLDLIKIYKEDIISLRNNPSSKSNIIIFESASLAHDSFILKVFKKQSNLICVACYQDNEKNIRNSIESYAMEFGLIIDKDSISHLAKKLGNDKLITKSEIEKLAIYADNKPLSYADLMDGTGDNSVLGMYKITDNFLLKNEVDVNYIYDRLIESGLSNFIIIRSLIRHLQILYQAKIAKKEFVTSIKPAFHFSRHKDVQEQLNYISIKKIEKFLTKLNILEKECKLFPNLSNILVKKFLKNI